MQAEYDVYRNMTAMYSVMEMVRPEMARASRVDPTTQIPIRDAALQRRHLEEKHSQRQAPCWQTAPRESRTMSLQFIVSCLSPVSESLLRNSHLKAPYSRNEIRVMRAMLTSHTARLKG